MRHGYSNPHLLAPTQFNACARTNHVLLCHHIYCEELLPNSRFQAQLFFQSLNKVHWLHPLPAYIHKITKCKHSKLPEFSFSVYVAITCGPQPFSLHLLIKKMESVQHPKATPPPFWGLRDMAILYSGSSGLPQALARYHHRFRILKRPNRNFFINRGLSTGEWAT